MEKGFIASSFWCFFFFTILFGEAVVSQTTNGEKGDDSNSDGTTRSTGRSWSYVIKLCGQNFFLSYQNSLESSIWIGIISTFWDKGIKKSNGSSFSSKIVSSSSSGISISWEYEIGWESIAVIAMSPDVSCNPFVVDSDGVLGSDIGGLFSFITIMVSIMEKSM